jgi:hypothetical protein
VGSGRTRWREQKRLRSARERCDLTFGAAAGATAQMPADATECAPTHYWADVPPIKREVVGYAAVAQRLWSTAQQQASDHLLP